jgi:hypothetical protein
MVGGPQLRAAVLCLINQQKGNMQLSKLLEGIFPATKTFKSMPWTKIGDSGLRHLSPCRRANAFCGAESDGERDSAGTSSSVISANGMQAIMRQGAADAKVRPRGAVSTAVPTASAKVSVCDLSPPTDWRFPRRLPSQAGRLRYGDDQRSGGPGSSRPLLRLSVQWLSDRQAVPVRIQTAR